MCYGGVFFICMFASVIGWRHLHCRLAPYQRSYCSLNFETNLCSLSVYCILKLSSHTSQPLKSEKNNIFQNIHITGLKSRNRNVMLRMFYDLLVIIVGLRNNTWKTHIVPARWYNLCHKERCKSRLLSKLTQPHSHFWSSLCHSLRNVSSIKQQLFLRLLKEIL